MLLSSLSLGGLCVSTKCFVFNSAAQAIKTHKLLYGKYKNAWKTSRNLIDYFRRMFCYEVFLEYSSGSFIQNSRFSEKNVSESYPKKKKHFFVDFRILPEILVYI